MYLQAWMGGKRIEYAVPEEDNKGVLQQSFPPLESRISDLCSAQTIGAAWQETSDANITSISEEGYLFS